MSERVTLPLSVDLLGAREVIRLDKCDELHIPLEDLSGKLYRSMSLGLDLGL